MVDTFGDVAMRAENPMLGKAPTKAGAGGRAKEL